MLKKTDVRLYLVDDNPSVLRSLCALIRAHGYEPHPFNSAEAFLEKYDDEHPGCILLDVKMPGMNGLELQNLLNERGGNVPVIILSGHGDVPAAVAAMKNGAVDFIEKPPSASVLLRAIENAIAHLNDENHLFLPKHEVNRRISRLTKREREVLDHLVLGKINKQIAVDMGISQRTVEIHRSQVMHKTGARSLAELVRMKLKLEQLED
ncbi:MAG: response regulator [Pseudomonadota bacterium]